MRILMVSSEVVPFAKAGGLGDMVGALAAELARQGHDVRVVLPRYYSVDPGRLRRLEAPLGVPMGYEEEWCGVATAKLPGTGVTVYFLDHQELFGRDGIYGTRSGPEFNDNLRRFTLLSRGALQLAKMLGWTPDVVHAHDWPAALVPVYLNTLERDGVFGATGSVLTIHNLAHQGIFPKQELGHTLLGWEHFHGAGLEHYDRVNLLQAGLRNADMLTTVSPTYAREIQTPELGERLDGLLRHRAADLVGVLNGIDYRLWDPADDPHLPAGFSADDLDGKAACKRALQQAMGLEAEAGTPLFAMVSRLVEQKGFGELCGPTHGSLYNICAELEVQFVILGTGEAWCEAELASLSSRLPNLAVDLEFNEPLSHLIMAGADFLLVPSVFEPCGLTQMYAMRYGTLPIVRRTGGLADTVTSYDEATGEGTGFAFDLLTPSSIYNTVGWALWTWHNRPEHVAAMQQRAMAERFSWEASAARYVEVYRGAVDRRAGRVTRTW
ncbi:MAG: glycogen synthase GlgA [Thermoanaerobaculales bacterium]|jgi:starch synthase|nr:glycogen synthase GlgA [Thermoanaerobaculales bacterium]